MASPHLVAKEVGHLGLNVKTFASKRIAHADAISPEEPFTMDNIAQVSMFRQAWNPVLAWRNSLGC